MLTRFAPALWRLAALIVIFSGCFIGGFLFLPRASAQGCPGGTIGGCTDLRQGVGFTLRARVSFYNPDGSLHHVSDDVRYESANGSYRHVSVNKDLTREYSHQVGRGFFLVDHKHQLLLKSAIVGPHRNTFLGSSPEELKASSNFVRTEPLFGYTAYVLQYKDRDTGVMFQEGWIIPELGVGFVKFNSYDRISGKLDETFEPTEIVIGEPDPTNLQLPNYPEKLSTPPNLPR